ncbi:MAG: hypothetical protein HC853_11870 [Anaerolineae bacterium]|nr:hypothetical protein [Anaerolineae bacterium]
MKFAFRQCLALLVGLALLVACGDSPAATPTPELITAPTATEPTVAATQLPEPTAAPAPTNTPELAPTVAPSTSTTANCVNRAGNVRDATVPDDTPFKPGVTFVKTWRIKNVGTCTWGAGYTVVFSVGRQHVHPRRKTPTAPRSPAPPPAQMLR